jgi:antitoxin component YwqK of YwqJK toxin-antitoxin module
LTFICLILNLQGCKIRNWTNGKLNGEYKEFDFSGKIISWIIYLDDQITQVIKNQSEKN